jgi:1,2-diacylglycerol 3-alpha-glucosyltransferase
MRILIAGQTYFPAANGQAVFTVHLAEGLAQLGHEVTVIAPADHFHSYHTECHNVRIERVAAIGISPRYPDVRLTLFSRVPVERALGACKPEVVHLQDHYPLCRQVFRSSRKRGLPVIGTNHFLPQNILDNVPIMPARVRGAATPVLWYTMLSLFNQLNLVTTPTDTAANILREQGILRPVQPISCGVDVTRFCPNPHINRAEVRRRFGLHSGRTLFLFVGRVDHEKRLDVLLYAFHQLNRDDVQLGIVGKGSHRKALQALAQELKLENQVVFLGYVPREDLPDLLDVADIFAMPSEAELQSIATLEAMASGLPVLAANARALPELVRHGVNGYLFRPGDVADAARQITRLLEEHHRWKAMGVASREQAMPHHLANVTRRYASLYQTLLVANPLPVTKLGTGIAYKRRHILHHSRR